MKIIIKFYNIHIRTMQPTTMLAVLVLFTWTRILLDFFKNVKVAAWFIWKKTNNIGKSSTCCRFCWVWFKWIVFKLILQVKEVFLKILAPSLQLYQKICLYISVDTPDHQKLCSVSIHLKRYIKIETWFFCVLLVFLFHQYQNI